MSGGGWGNPVVGGTVMRIPALQSPDFVDGVSGWQITIAGNAQFNQVQARGEFFLDGANGSAIQVTLNSGVPVIFFVPQSVTQLTTDPQIFANADNAGAANELMILNLLSGKSNGQADAGVQLFGESADGTIPAQIVFEFGGTPVLLLTTAGFTSDSWHPAALAGGWTGSGSGANGLFYYFTLDGQVRIIADIVHPTATGNSVCFTLPPGYRPGTAQNRPIGWNNPQATGAASVPWVNVDQSGDIQVTGITVAGKQIFFDISLPLSPL